VSVIGVKTIIKISEPVTDYSFFDANCAKPLKFMWQSRGFNRVNLKATFLCSNMGMACSQCPPWQRRGWSGYGNL